MQDKESVVKNIVQLADEGIFSIKKINFDENFFGNFCIELTYEKKIDIRFIRDRGIIWCKIGRDGEWYFIEDVLGLIEKDFIFEKNEADKFMSYISGILIKNITEIMNIFDDKNIADTHAKIKKIETERALEMFK